MGLLSDIVPVLTRTAGNVAWERLTRPRPTTLDRVPPSPESLTPAWLTAALCREVSGAEVTDFQLGPRNDGTSSRRMITVRYNDTGRRAGLPTALFSKSTPTLLTRLTTSAANLLPAEHAFYSEIRAQLDLEAPVARFAAWDRRTDRSLFLMDDVTVTRDARVDTVLTRQTTRAQAEGMISLLASLHATFWGGAALTRYPWLMTPARWQDRIDRLMYMDRNAVTGFRRAASVIPSGVAARRNDFLEALSRCRQRASRGPVTLLHCDVHAGNWYVTGDDAMGLFDWQCMLKGRGMQDVTYALVANLSIENRRRWERDLVNLYVERVASHGVSGLPGGEALWLEYRQMVMHPMFMWLGTIGANRLQPEMQDPAISLANVERAAQACLDLDSFEALGM